MTMNNSFFYKSSFINCDAIFNTMNLSARFFIKHFLVLVFFCSLHAKAGFLDLPDTSEVPEFERESLLLDMDIPSVRDRDPNPEAGPRLNIKEFRVQGLIEYPKLDITREKIIAQVEKIRFNMMDEEKLLSSGYTLDELKEVSDLIAEIEQETEGRHVGSVEVQKLVFLIREQRRQRGVTLGMIETVADTITRYYRERGFILAKAYIPKQHVRDGVVTITLLLGELGEVNVQNNKRYSENVIKRGFKNLLAKPVTNEYIEEGLYLVNDLPGLSVSGYFEPGSQVGDTKLNINVNSERWYDANLRLDNHGSALSGEYRAYTDFSFNNPTGIGDKLHVGILGSFSPENSTFGSLSYSLPIYTPRLNFQMGVSNNNFALGLFNVDEAITGESVITDASLSYKLQRSRVKNHTVGIGFSQIESETYNFLFDSQSLSTVTNAEVFYNFDLLNQQNRILHQGKLAVILGKFEGDEATEALEESPVIYSFDYSRLSFIKLPFFASESKMVLRGSGQYSGKPMTAVLQYSLAGPMKARGFEVNEFYADDALFFGADLIFNGFSFNGLKIADEPFNKILQPTVFLDAGYAGRKAYLEEEEDVTAHLVDAGFGFKINFKDTVSGNLTFAFPISAKDSSRETSGQSEPVVENPDDDNDLGVIETKDPSKTDTVPGDSLKVYFDLQIGF